MKKYIVLCAGMCLALSFTGCKSSDKAYRQAYDKAQQQVAAQQTQNQYETPVVQQVQTVTPSVSPVQTQPVTQTQVVDNVDNVAVRQIQVQLVNGTGLKNFSVVVGSFSVIANAENLQQRLKNSGYNAQIVMSDGGQRMYRVVASTFDNKSDAVVSRDQLRGQYPDAWLLYYNY